MHFSSSCILIIQSVEHRVFLVPSGPIPFSSPTLLQRWRPRPSAASPRTVPRSPSSSSSRPSKGISGSSSSTGRSSSTPRWRRTWIAGWPGKGWVKKNRSRSFNGFATCCASSASPFFRFATSLSTAAFNSRLPFRRIPLTAPPLAAAETT